MRRWILSLLLLVAGACQANPDRGDSVLAGWADIPVPRGFRLVDQPHGEVPVSVGEYRAGKFLFEGRGSLPTVGDYYRSHMPLHGWTWDPAGTCWRKGPSRVSLILTGLATPAYASDYGLVRYQLEVRSERPPMTPETEPE
ncbi:MAG: hypothetical protein EYC70_09225 [Planctomycetota bacterium]|nr:MAG: hypothetical protein EYC70_09225 [Planctomycetota bacterium]